jgi:hypothetical protein
MNPSNLSSPSTNKPTILTTLKTCFFASLLALTLALVPSALHAQDADANPDHSRSNPQAGVKFTGQQLNTLVSQEATQNMETIIAANLGGSVSGTWNGTVTDSSWELTDVRKKRGRNCVTRISDFAH